MSHLREDSYVSKIEKIEQEQNVKKECCYYELHDGSWLCIETTYIAEEKEWGKDWKLQSSKSSSCQDKPGTVEKEENLKRLVEVAKNLKV